jgi:general secretion pathway protein A
VPAAPAAAVATADPAPEPAASNATTALGLEPVVQAAALSDLGSLVNGAPTEEGAQLGGLARLWQNTLGEGDPCKGALAAGLHCFQSAGGLAELRQLGRPAIVAVKDDAGVQRHLLLVALGNAGAGLQAGDQVRIVSLVALGRRMPGRFLTLWRAPPDFRTSLKPGDRGADVDWVAARLSVVNNYAQPEPGRQYDAALAREVRTFQTAQGLPADGIVGPKTMMALNGAAGVPEPTLAEPQLGAQGK